MNNLKLYREVYEDKECLLCPHFCILKNGETGKCRVRKNDGEKIALINYGIINAMTISSIEKKPFKHFFPGTKTLTLSLTGKCQLSCKFCENHKLSQKDKLEGKNISPEDIVLDAIEKHCKSVCMSFNEPTISYEFLIDLAEECHKNDLKFILKTNAFVNKEPWKEICSVSDSLNIDWKGSERSFRDITGCEPYVIEERIREAQEAGIHIEISIPLYYEDEILEEEIENVGKFLSSIDKDIPCHLLRISPSYKYEDFIFKTSNLIKAQNILSNYMINIYMVM
jgi:pyruvate formate lyase activating enzyme